jgi:primosomal protein N' (replication factor Y) (superfamily II helicase)
MKNEVIATIIPAVRLPRKLSEFSYLVPEKMAGEIKVGMIVGINFRGKEEFGLILKIEKQKLETACLPVRQGNWKLTAGKKYRFELKPIKKILFPAPLLTPIQIELIKKIADYYGVSAGIVCRSFLPALYKRQLRIYESYEYTNQIVKTPKNKPLSRLFWWTSLEERNKEYKRIINKNKGQILILTPQIELIEKLVTDLKLDDKKVVRIHNGIKPKDFFDNWLRVLSGKPMIVIGTKMAVTLPFSNLKTIIVDEEQDFDHKQSDINPRYDARTVAEWLTDYFGAELILASVGPRVETYAKLNNKIDKSDKSNKSDKTNNNTIIVDLRDEKNKGNYSLLSDLLKEKIEENLAQGRKIFLLHNRKGLANFVACRDCGYVFLCPECQTSLGYFQSTQKMNCHYCSYTEEVPPLCPKCGGPNFSFKSKGVEDLALELKKVFPEVNVAATFKNEGKKIDFKETQIIAGTEFALNKIDWEKIGLAGVINFDQFINRPDFRAQENSYSFLAGLTARVAGEILVQTHNPENLVLENWQKRSPEIFYEAELKNRQELGYPPFVRLVKIIGQDKNSARAEKAMEKFIENIKREKPELIVLGPLRPVPEKTRGAYFFHCIIKLPSEMGQKEVFDLVPNDFVIDFEPEKLT